MSSQPVRARPSLFRALGRQDPPVEVTIRGKKYQRIDIYKHDSWAATALYRGDDGDVVCKFNRTQPIVIIPMKWLGRMLARREARALQRLNGVPGIPAESGAVFANGRHCENTVAHEFIAGHPLGANEEVSSTFFIELRQVLDAVHRNGIAYVDLHKRENIVVNENGRPYLVDFQVCFARWWPRQGANPLHRMILRVLQQIDWYHFGKHVSRHRPEQMSLLPAGMGERPMCISMHRLFAVPLRTLRRSLLTALGVRAAGGQATSEAFPEDAVRRELQRAA